ncbi:aspartate-semialdehyde dehydrogenase [bacterium]|nr:MAG: aspartate-semialdehyde dehydrogenase [bacterium]
MKTQYSVGILGATGAVGQKFIRLLENHPWFTIKALGASERSAGKTYAEAANWIEAVPCPGTIKNMTVAACDPEFFKGIDFVFSGLDSSVATEVEGAFAAAGIPVISNAKNYRTGKYVPLLVPEVNPDHIHSIKQQTYDPSGKGFIVTNPNCVTVPLVMALKPLQEAFGINYVILTSMQAVSGAGYPGVPSLDIMGNIVPFISGEEPKIASEPLKLLGELQSDGTVKDASFPVQATAVRVPVLEGHLLSVSVSLKNKPASIEEVEAVWNNWKNPLAELNLPFAPEKPIVVTKEDRYPQPRLHSYDENGMRTTIGRARLTTITDLSFVALAHNTVRGAAGGAILNAELLVKEGYL